LRAPEAKPAEMNEAGWWSNWARLRWRGEGYLLSSDELTEPFFNRAGTLTCRAVRPTAAWAEAVLGASGKDSEVLAFDKCKGARALLGSGYEQEDVMSVLFSQAPFEADPRAGVVRATASENWTSAYLRAFYDEERLADVVRPIVSSLLDSKRTTLLEARVKGETAGVLAVFRTSGLAGVYCVGTVPEFRKRGVATSLLASARRSAEAEERTVVLQTLTSDGVLPFYLKRGFREVYSKRVLVRKLK
jgi:GNAT superfamily N-acetyltransferase